MLPGHCCLFLAKDIFENLNRFYSALKDFACSTIVVRPSLSRVSRRNKPTAYIEEPNQLKLLKCGVNNWDYSDFSFS